MKDRRRDTAASLASRKARRQSEHRATRGERREKKNITSLVCVQRRGCNCACGVVP